MNIKSIVNPLIYNRKEIDDQNWEIRVTVTNNIFGSNIRIACENSITAITKRGLEKKVGFSIIFLINRDGSIVFNKITLKRIDNSVTRIITRDLLCKVFRESIEKRLNEGA